MSDIVLSVRPHAGRCRVALAALAAVVLAAGLTAPAFAADRDRHDSHHAVRHYHRGPSGPVYGYGAPAYVQAPPPVVYAPPVYATPFSLGLNFNIR